MGYVFKHTPTNTLCGGAGLYIRETYNFEVIRSLSKSIDDVSESLFLEIKREGQKNVIIGCIYRHHSPIPKFTEAFFENALDYMTRHSSKISSIMGDFNVDLVKYSSDLNTSIFYDLLSSHNFRPLVLQPTRVTSKTTSLIDNIFINDVSCRSYGGNITASISDHFFQFSLTDIFENPRHKGKIKYGRDFRNFNKREFQETLEQTDWSRIVNEDQGTDQSYTNFYRKLEDILDLMAPYRKLTQKEIKLQTMPWITRGILVSMKVRDKLYKQIKLQKQEAERDILSYRYKRYRNKSSTYT